MSTIVLRTSTASADAEDVLFDGQRLVLTSEISAPPGSPLYLSGEHSPREVALKTIRCQRSRSTPPRFRIEARPVNLSREQREWLDTLARRTPLG